MKRERGWNEESYVVENEWRKGMISRHLSESGKKKREGDGLKRAIGEEEEERKEWDEEFQRG